MHLFILSVGEISGNYSSVRKNPNNPKWAIKEQAFTKDMKQAISLNDCYFLFKPSKISCKKAGIQHKLVGLAKISSIIKREIGPLISVSESNEDRGWIGDGFEYDLNFEKYWDLEKLYTIKSNIFLYEKINSFKLICRQAACYNVSKNNQLLYDYLFPHINYIINCLQPAMEL